MRYVHEVMTHPVVTAHDWTPFKDLVRLMQKHDVSALPVLDRADRLVGIVSEADLMLKEEHAAGDGSSGRLLAEDESGRNGVHPWVMRNKAQGVVARDLMTSPAVTVRREAPVALAARIMREKGVKRLPVVDPHGRLEGIVSRSDLLTAFLRPDDEIRSAIESALIAPRPSIEQGQIQVIVVNGVAQLEGRVGLKSQIPRIVSIARTIDGVVDVESRLGYETDDVGLERRSPSPRTSLRVADPIDDAWRSPRAPAP